MFQISPCVPTIDVGSLVTVWGGVRWEPASQSSWDEPNWYKNSAKLVKMAHNGQNPALWPLLIVGWHWAVNSISLCIKWYDPLHRHWIEVEKLIWEGGGLRGAPRGWHLARWACCWPCTKNHEKKMKIFFSNGQKSFSSYLLVWWEWESRERRNCLARGGWNCTPKWQKKTKNSKIPFLPHSSPANGRLCGIKTYMRQSLYQGWTQFYVWGSVPIGVHRPLKPNQNGKNAWK